MSDSSLTIPPEFRTLEVPKSLEPFLEHVRAAVETRKKYVELRRYTKMTAVGLPFVTAFWVVVLGAIRWYSGSFAFVWTTMDCGLMAAILVVGLGLFLLFGGPTNDDYETKKAVIGLGGIAIAMAFTFAFLPFFPLILAGLVVVAFPFLQHQEGKHKATQTRSDIRFRDFEGLIEHIESWQQVAQWANQLRLRVVHNLLQGSDRERAVQLLADLQADERFVHDRMAYCTSLASQGPLGSRVTRDDMGALLISDLSDRLDGFRDRVEKLREFARTAIAAGEVRKLGTV